jgi:hypothetical protein
MLRNARLALFAGIAGFAMAYAGNAQAQTSSDESAAILVWPKVVYDSQGILFDNPTDTLINLSSTATSSLKQAHCFLVNATSHCVGGSNDGDACLESSACGGGVCTPGWNEIDFNVYITPEQPLAWFAGDGLSREDLPIAGPGTCSNNPARICLSNAQCGGGTCQIGPNGQNNLGSSVPPVPEDPFIGSLTCIQYDPTQNPPVPDQSPSTNALIGEATIFAAQGAGGVDGAKYNAVGFLATADSGADTDNVLELGTPATDAVPPVATADYTGCAGTLIVNHYFDGATDPMSVGNGTNSGNGETSTSLTLVPCGNNLLTQEPGSVVAQFLVFNEFEQRFSSSTRVDCVYDSEISNIDTPNNERSIWSTGVSGTLTGQTRIQGVGNAETGKGLTGIATLSIDTEPGVASAAYSLDQQGTTAAGDLLTIP